MLSDNCVVCGAYGNKRLHSERQVRAIWRKWRHDGGLESVFFESLSTTARRETI